MSSKAITLRKDKINKKKRIRIVHIINGLKIGGAETILNKIVRSLDEFEHIIISLKCLGYYGDFLKDDGYEVYSLNLRNNPIILSKLFNLFLLLKRLKPDIVNTWLYHADLIGGVIAKVAGVKKIIWTIRHDYKASEIVFYKRIIIRMLGLLTNVIPYKIISNSKTAAQNHIEQGYKKSLISIINNGVCIKKFRPDKIIGSKYRLRLGISEKEFVIGMIARYHPIKDHDNLLRSLAIINSVGKNFKCILVGRGINESNKALTNKIQGLNLTNHIILLEESNSVNKIMNVLDIHVLSSRSECFPNVIIEAMSCGIPCISTKVGEVNNIIRNSGWIVEPINSNKLSEAIIESMESNRLHENGLLSRKIIESKYTVEIMISKYKAFYKAISGQDF